MKKEHLYFVPKNKLAVTLPAEANDADKSTMRVFIPLLVDKSNVGVKVEYNYALDRSILILNFKIVCDLQGDNNGIEFLCLKVEEVYTNKGPKMIVVKTDVQHDKSPPWDVSLSKYPEWESPVLTYTLGNNAITGVGEIEPNANLRLDTESNDSCTIPPKD